MYTIPAVLLVVFTFVIMFIADKIYTQVILIKLYS